MTDLFTFLVRRPGFRVLWDSERQQQCLVLNVAYRWTVRLSPWRDA